MTLSRARAFVTDSTVFAHGQPFVAPAPLMDSGAFLGYYLGSVKPFFLYPARLMEVGAHSLVVLVAGEKNTGKSSFLKDASAKFCALQAGRGADPNNPPAMRVRFYDRKPNQVQNSAGMPLRGEFAALVDHLLGETVSLADRGLVNPFDPRMGTDVNTVTEIAYDLGEGILKRPLRNYEGPALEIAVKRMFANGQHHVDPFRSYLAMPNSEDIARHYADDRYVSAEAAVAVIDDSRLYSAFREDSTRMSGAFKSLLGGAYGGIFGGTGSLYDVFASDIVNLDWTGVAGAGGDLLEPLINRWLTTALRLQLPLNPNLWVIDEEGTRIKNLPHATTFAQYVREARAYAMITMLATQFSTDFDNLGNAGDTIRGLGREIENGISVRIYGRQPNTPEIIQSITRQGISLGDALSTTLLPQGCWGIKLPDRPIQFFQHVIAQRMLPLYETNRATKGLAEGYFAEDIPYAKERLRKINALWPQVNRQLTSDPDSYEAVRTGFYQEIGETNETTTS